MPEFLFKGKEFVYNHHLSIPFRPLVFHDDKSVRGNAYDGNLIVHGDNLHALKALMPAYAGRIDCVVIDPPYNTGTSSWNYNDNVNGPMMQEWLRSNPVNGDDMLRHDKWLCMMMPRMKLLYELMAERAIIAVTIDNNELPRLWGLLDEIFGEEQFIACAPWLSEPSGGKEKTGLRTGHEYVLMYAKSDPDLSQDATDLGELELTDKFGPYLKGRELRKWGGVSLRSDRTGQWFPLRAPDGTEVWPIKNDGKDGHWRWGPNNPEMLEILADPERAHWELRPFDPNISWQGRTERWVPYAKIRTSKRGVGWSTWLDNLAYNSDGTRTIKEIFGEKIFDTPKPVELIEWIISLCGDDEAIVLDSFAGSGTTAHAVLNLNLKDGGHRRFILAESEDYAESITAERLRRVIEGYDFSGTQKEELYSDQLTFSKLRNADKIMEQIVGIENLESHRFDRITKTIKDGKVVVVGEKDIQQRAVGLGGNFSFCTLGEAIDLNKILNGEGLPAFNALGGLLFHTATNEAFDAKSVVEMDEFGYLGESMHYHVWLIYKPDLAFLRSRDAALTLSKAEAIAVQKAGKTHLVFAPAKFVSQKLLNERKLHVEFAPLPFSLYRVERS